MLVREEQSLMYRVVKEVRLEMASKLSRRCPFVITRDVRPGVRPR